MIPKKVFFCWRFLLILATALHIGLVTTSAQQEREPDDLFESKIRPLLSAHCFACHSDRQQLAGLNLSTAATFFKGADTGPIVVKGNPEQSRLIEVLSYESKVKMPPTGKLNESEIAAVKTWIRLGAAWPKSEAAATIPLNTKNSHFTPEQTAFWSFQPVRDYNSPQVSHPDWCQSPIDRFILAGLDRVGLEPAPPAKKLALLRRATFDLTGLPPTEFEIDEFLSDRSPEAFSKVIDRLLASPRYGERWGRHWLDVARYADSAGADEDIRYPYAYRYRDYVISAFNRDLPYDEFLKEQIAGDLLPAKDHEDVNIEGIVATGFLQVGPKLLAEQDKPKMFYDMVDEQVDVTTRAFLGLTVSCARCHDHKFDPIPTRDYYSLASIFASTKSLSKVEGTVSQLYFAPLVRKEVADEYNQHQNKIKSKEDDVTEIVDSEALRYADALISDLPRYLLEAWRYDTRPKNLNGTRLSDFALERHLNLTVLQRWIEYLRPTSEIRPHLKEWYSRSTAAQKDAVDDGKYFDPTPALVQVAESFKQELQTLSAERKSALEEYQFRLRESRRSGEPPPEKGKLKIDVARHRFLTDLIGPKGPLAIPEKDPEQSYSEASKARLQTLRAEIQMLKQASPPEPALACAVTEGPIVQQKVFIRGNWSNPGEDAPKRFLSIIAGENQKPILEGSGRLQLANWLAKPDHPLTSRVMANRIWQWHFGEGLVRTASNFGKLGEAPSHPELLDFLARQFVAKGWSIKAMHRLIMLSSTYQMSSDVSKEAAEIDVSNRWHSRANRLRLDVEEIRDGMLALTGELDLTMGGTLQAGFGTDGENSAERLSINPDQSKRRTVYLSIRRSNLPNVLNLFDFGDATSPGEGRSRTNVAPQALYMMNGRAVGERALHLAESLIASNGTDLQRVAQVFRRIYGREPSAEETKDAFKYLQEYKMKVSAASQEAATTPTLKAWQSFCRLLLCSNEFIYVD